MENISLVKIEGGRTIAFDAKGNYIKNIGEPGAVGAQIQEDAISIFYTNGKTKIYNLKGYYVKTL